MNIDSTNIQPCHWLAIEQEIEGKLCPVRRLSSPTARTPWLIPAAALSYLIQHLRLIHHHHGAQKPIDMEETRMPGPPWRTACTSPPVPAAFTTYHCVFDGKQMQAIQRKEGVDKKLCIALHQLSVCCHHPGDGQIIFLPGRQGQG